MVLFNQSLVIKDVSFYHGPEDRSYRTNDIYFVNYNEWYSHNLYNSVVGKYGVQDFRWEGFTNFIVKNKLMYRFPAPEGRRWTLNLSLKGLNDAYIYLCENEYINMKMCLWIIFGGANNLWSGYRIMNKKIMIREIKNETSINTTRWNHVKLERNGDNLKFQLENWKWNVNLEESLYYLIFKTYVTNKEGIEWRVHSKEFLGTLANGASLESTFFQADEKNSVCLSFFYYIPLKLKNAQLTLEIFNSEHELIASENIRNSEEDKDRGWKRFENTFDFTGISDKNVYLKLIATFNGNILNEEPYNVFAVDDVKLCSPEGTIHTMQATVLSEDYARLPSCQFLQFPDLNLIAQEPQNYSIDCEAGQLLFNCSATCTDLFVNQNHADCTNAAICVLRNGHNECSCSRGHRGNLCYKCPADHYGDMCSENCGKCNGGKSCHWATGVCEDGCKKGYVPEYCKETYPILNRVPSRVISSPSSLSFDVDFTDVSGYGKPTMYQIQYKEAYSSYNWNEDKRHRIDWNKETLKLNNLEKLRHYELRIVLFLNKNSYQENNLPKFYGNTSCEEIEIQDPITYKRSIEVLWKENNIRDACPLHIYQVKLSAGINGKLIQHESFHYERNTIFVELEPYNNYTVKTVNSLTGTEIYVKVVRTNQDAPTAPCNLRTVSIYSDKSTIKWDKPKKRNGVLDKFNVTVVMSKTLLLKGTVPEFSYELHVSPECYNFTHMVKNLFPSTWYQVNVSGVTVAQGPGATLDLQTPLSEPVYTEPLALVKECLTTSTAEITVPPASEYLTINSSYLVMAACNSCYIESTSSVPVLHGIHWNELLSQSQLNDYGEKWIAGEVKPTFSQVNFTIGNNSYSDGYIFGEKYVNHPLDFYTTYKIVVVVVNKQGENTTFTTIELPEDLNLSKILQVPTGTNSGLIAFFVLALLIIILITGFLIYKRRQTFPSVSRSGLAIPLTQPKDEACILKPPAPEPQSDFEELNDEPQPTPSQWFSCRVAIGDLENYVVKGILSGELRKQYLMFPRGQTQPWDYGKLPQNKPKNRYGNLIAYESSRVILEKLPGDEYSDYINANYIDGYNAKRMYIATQGPRPNTVDDFWRMIWQEQIHIIAMLTNLVENGKTKCEHYWPDYRKEETHGNVTIMTGSEQVFADFTLRTLKITCQGKDRKVVHLHFTSWPDHGIPFYPQSVACYLKKLLATPRGPGPILVHCSAGVGRTGTIILADICLRMAAAERAVDVLRYLQIIREQRPNMVDNLEQFKLVHLVLIECLVEEQSSYSCNSLPKYVEKIREDGTLVKQFQRLEELRLQNQMLHQTDSQPKEMQFADKNRFQDIVPGQSGRVYLSRNAVPGNTSDYINAVYVDGFRIRDQFIVTQYPLPSTVGDFWRVVVEKNISLVVMLNDLEFSEMVPEFCPMNDEDFSPVPHLKIKLKQKSHAHLWSLMKFQITDSSSNMGVSQHQVVRMIHLSGWSADCNLPQEPGVLIHLWQEVEANYCGKGPTLVMCLDGARACGLFLASAFVIEKMKLEQECDVCHAVRAIRQNRKQFIQSKEQFEFLYDIAVNYLEAFTIYSNFG